jgi:hypothetical protein
VVSRTGVPATPGPARSLLGHICNEGSNIDRRWRVVQAGMASATPPCYPNYELDATGQRCVPYFSTQIGGCSTAAGSTSEQQQACLGDG